jgi:hypothetical protein
LLINRYPRPSLPPVAERIGEANITSKSFDFVDMLSLGVLASPHLSSAWLNCDQFIVMSRAASLTFADAAISPSGGD